MNIDFHYHDIFANNGEIYHRQRKGFADQIVALSLVQCGRFLAICEKLTAIDGSTASTYLRTASGRLDSVLLKHGQLIPAETRVVVHCVDAGRCHWNVCDFLELAYRDASWIGYHGYAMSAGEWAAHSWLMRDGVIYETNGKAQERYYGIQFGTHGLTRYDFNGTRIEPSRSALLRMAELYRLPAALRA